MITFVIVLITSMTRNMPKVFRPMHAYWTVRMRPNTRSWVISRLWIDWVYWAITANLINCKNKLFKTVERLMIRFLVDDKLMTFATRFVSNIEFQQFHCGACWVKLIEVFSCELKSKTCFKSVSPNGLAVPRAEKKYVERLISNLYFLWTIECNHRQWFLWIRFLSSRS